MKRRSFLQLGGCAVAAASLGLKRYAYAAEQAAGDTKMRISGSLLNERNQNRSTVAACHGMVCTSQPLASVAGLAVLKAGGSAVDAAIAANAMLSLVEPMNCGPGGDLFAIVWDEKNRKLHGLNASGRAPYDWDLKSALDLGLKSIAPLTPLAWSVPGCVSGWEALHGRFGRLGVDRLLAPAIQYAREGFPVTPIIASDWPFDPAKFPTLAETFLPGGNAPRFGEMFRNPDLAAFYERLVTDGLNSFYQGEIAERIVRFSEVNGGRFSERDFREHHADWIEPVSTSYRGFDVWELPPNGQGIAALQILNLLEGFDIAALEPNSAAHLHLFVEAKRLAYEDRARYYADPEFAKVPVDWLISKEYGKERARLIDPSRASEIVAAGKGPSGDETIYLTASDAEGNMVSLIQSTYHGWGSHFVPDRLGFSLQNRGELFALDAKHPNRLEPHKRPFHTIIPAFVTQVGAPKFAFGVMGGDFQPQGHVQVLMNLLDFGMSPQQAGEQPRVEHGGSSTPTGFKATGKGAVRVERHISEATREGLVALGHQVKPGAGSFGGYQGIWREDEPMRYFGGSDPRKDGAAMGY
jgi:gamma-glutamyltranspeptidase/glutathione hydrolase